MLLLVTIAANAETRYRAYCEMIYSAITQQTIIIIEGELRNIKDKNGLPLKFKTMDRLAIFGFFSEPMPLQPTRRRRDSGAANTMPSLLEHC